MGTLEMAVTTEKSGLVISTTSQRQIPLLCEHLSNNSVTSVCFHVKQQIESDNLLSIRFYIFVIKTEPTTMKANIFSM